jgi:protein disulfide-isomerase A1
MFPCSCANFNFKLIAFSSFRCGHCKSLAPEYAKAAKALANAPVKLAKVDATANNAIATQFEIRGFPTLKFFKNGKPSEYNGGRTESEIVSWLNKKIGPAATTVKTEEELLNLQESNDVVILGAFSSADSEAAKTFLNAASGDEVHVYAVTYDDAVKTKLGVSTDSVVLLKSFDELRADLTVSSETNADAITSFVTANASPLVQEFSPESSKKIFSSQITKHFLFFTNKEDDHHATTVATFKEVAAQFRGKALFVNVPTSEKRILDFFEVNADDTPAAILADLGAESGIKKYPFKGDFSTSALATFVGDFFDGKLQAHLKSEEVVPEDTAGNVVVLKGKSFNDLVVNNNKDVLVEFYAPW